MKLAVLSILLLAGCGDEDGDDIGLVITEWSLEQRDCEAVGADLFEAVFFDQNGVFSAEVEERCELGTASFFLDEGTYDVATRLITIDQDAVSDTLFFEDVLVESESGAVLHSDFPLTALPD